MVPLLEDIRGDGVDASIYIVRPETQIIPRRVRVLMGALIEGFDTGQEAFAKGMTYLVIIMVIT
ncbi:hypothetical protein QQF40_16675 [Cobetia sp. LC6]|uniref:hypothetical protein n=1 Tax=Cobetia sp. LC6 TaxID=3050947 RepID=UPI00159E0280|nr:hypothetical protein [Cobetia sp. LC6]MDL2193012.1 hypothetical protein [Cobetia sp. LC6]NVN55636.1 hypothetical protein [bacterium Scap17]